MEEEVKKPEGEKSILSAWWFWLLVIVIIGLIVWAVIAQRGKTPTPGGTTPTPTAPETPKPPETPTPTPETPAPTGEQTPTPPPEPLPAE